MKSLESDNASYVGNENEHLVLIYLQTTPCCLILIVIELNLEFRFSRGIGYPEFRAGNLKIGREFPNFGNSRKIKLCSNLTCKFINFSSKCTVFLLSNTI